MRLKQTFFLIAAMLCMSSLSAKEDLLYLVHGDEGVYKNEKLTITGVAPRVSYFSKGPNRRAGVMAMDKFVKQIKKDSPAHLVYHQETDDTFHDIKVSINNPHYDSETELFEVKLTTTESLPEGKPLESVTLFLELSRH